MEEEAVKRNTKQYLAPMKAQATPRGVYDLYPAFPVGENKIPFGDRVFGRLDRATRAGGYRWLWRSVLGRTGE